MMLGATKTESGSTTPFAGRSAEVEPRKWAHHTSECEYNHGADERPQVGDVIVLCRGGRLWTVVDVEVDWLRLKPTHRDRWIAQDWTAHRAHAHVVKPAMQAPTATHDTTVYAEQAALF